MTGAEATALSDGMNASLATLKDVAGIMERTYPDEDARPFRLLRGAGSERIEFDNGSVLSFVAPKGDSFRSDAFDVIILDEAGEPEAELSDDVWQLPYQRWTPGPTRWWDSRPVPTARDAWPPARGPE